MPKNVSITDKQTLFSVPLPVGGTVVSHKFIVDEVLTKLQLNKFTIIDEVYKMNLNGEIAQGIYKLECEEDPELGLMFAWSNSYDKTMKFRCAIGAWVTSNGNCMIAEDATNYGKKNVADTTADISFYIDQQLANANKYYKDLIRDKENMKKIFLDKSKVGKLMGTLYFDKEVITSSQLITIKDRSKKILNFSNVSLWEIYNQVTDALKSSHPKTWMDQQKNLHTVVRSDMAMQVLREVVTEASQTNDPNQLDLIIEIEAAEEKVENTNLNYLSNEGSSHNPEVDEREDNKNIQEEDSEDLIDLSGFPDAPDDLPVFIPELQEVKEPETKDEFLTEDKPIPLHEQIASEEILPVTEEELEISEPPIVDLEDSKDVYAPDNMSGTTTIHSALEDDSNTSKELPQFEF